MTIVTRKLPTADDVEILADERWVDGIVDAVLSRPHDVPQGVRFAKVSRDRYADGRESVRVTTAEIGDRLMPTTPYQAGPLANYRGVASSDVEADVAKARAWIASA